MRVLPCVCAKVYRVYIALHGVYGCFCQWRIKWIKCDHVDFITTFCFVITKQVYCITAGVPRCKRCVLKCVMCAHEALPLKRYGYLCVN